MDEGQKLVDEVSNKRIDVSFFEHNKVLHFFVPVEHLESPDKAESVSRLIRGIISLDGSEVCITGELLMEQLSEIKDKLEASADRVTVLVVQGEPDSSDDIEIYVAGGEMVASED